MIESVFQQEASFAMVVRGQGTDSMQLHTVDVHRVPADEKKGLYLRVRWHLDACAAEMRRVGIPQEAVEQRLIDDPFNCLERFGPPGACADFERAVLQNLRLAIHFVRGYARAFGCPVQDLLTDAYLGLIRALVSHDPERGALSTYASYWIKRTVVRKHHETGRTIRLPTHMLTWLNQRKQAAVGVRRKLGRAPESEEIAAEMGIDLETLRKNELLARTNFLSLDAAISREALGHFLGRTPGKGREEGVPISEHTLTHLLPTEEPSPEDALLEHERLAHVNGTVLQDALARLTPIEQDVIRSRFGLGRDDATEVDTLLTVGKRWRRSRERIRQIQVRAMQKLRKSLAPHLL